MTKLESLLTYLEKNPTATYDEIFQLLALAVKKINKEAI